MSSKIQIIIRFKRKNSGILLKKQFIKESEILKQENVTELHNNLDEIYGVTHLFDASINFNWFTKIDKLIIGYFIDNMKCIFKYDGKKLYRFQICGNMPFDETEYYKRTEIFFEKEEYDVANFEYLYFICMPTVYLYKLNDCNPIIPYLENDNNIIEITCY